jgi:hypothetical protein
MAATDWRDRERLCGLTLFTETYTFQVLAFRDLSQARNAGRETCAIDTTR